MLLILTCWLGSISADICLAIYGQRRSHRCICILKCWLHSTPLSRVLPCPPCMLLILTCWLGSVHKGSGCLMPGKSRGSAGKVISASTFASAGSTRVLKRAALLILHVANSNMLARFSFWHTTTFLLLFCFLLMKGPGRPQTKINPPERGADLVFYFHTWIPLRMSRNLSLFTAKKLWWARRFAASENP